MKIAQYDFEWFEKEDGRRQLYASVDRHGWLFLGTALRKALPQTIRLGFDTKTKTLALADGHGEGCRWQKSGKLRARTLSTKIVSLGLSLPVAFLLERDETSGYYVGRIAPDLRRTKEMGKRDDEELLILYQHIVDKAVFQFSKSIPPKERRTIAQDALLLALREYAVGCGDVEDYLEQRVHKRLMEENKVYAYTFAERSADKPLAHDGDGPFCLLDTEAFSSDGGLDALEERIMQEQFFAGLSEREQRICRMLRAGVTLSAIAEELQCDVGEVEAIGGEIARKRREFYDVA